MKHVGILAHSTEGAALYFLAFCQEGFRQLGRNEHPDVTLDYIAFGYSMPACRDSRPPPGRTAARSGHPAGRPRVPGTAPAGSRAHPGPGSSASRPPRPPRGACPGPAGAASRSAARTATPGGRLPATGSSRRSRRWSAPGRRGSCATPGGPALRRTVPHRTWHSRCPRPSRLTSRQPCRRSDARAGGDTSRCHRAIADHKALSGRSCFMVAGTRWCRAEVTSHVPDPGPASLDPAGCLRRPG